MRCAPNKQDLAPLHALSLLFVDDDEGIRKGMSRALKRHFLSYYDAPNGREGLEIFRQYKPDIVITDVTMPVMDGLELARRITQENENVPIIINSAHNEIDFLIEAIDIGIDSYILKPTNINALLLLILKSARPILKQRILESQHRLIQHLLELSANPTLIASGNNLECANKAFLDFIGYDSEAELHAQFAQSSHTALIDSAITQAAQFDCLEKIRNSGDVLYQLHQISKKPVDFSAMTRFDMPDIDKSVFTLKGTLN